MYKIVNWMRKINKSTEHVNRNTADLFVKYINALTVLKHTLANYWAHYSVNGAEMKYLQKGISYLATCTIFSCV
jgi:hypothetical protein